MNKPGWTGGRTRKNSTTVPKVDFWPLIKLCKFGFLHTADLGPSEMLLDALNDWFGKLRCRDNSARQWPHWAGPSAAQGNGWPCCGGLSVSDGLKPLTDPLKSSG